MDLVKLIDADGGKLGAFPGLRRPADAATAAARAVAPTPPMIEVAVIIATLLGGLAALWFFWDKIVAGPSEERAADVAAVRAWSMAFRWRDQRTHHRE